MHYICLSSTYCMCISDLLSTFGSNSGDSGKPSKWRNSGAITVRIGFPFQACESKTTCHPPWRKQSQKNNNTFVFTAQYRYIYCMCVLIVLWLRAASPTHKVTDKCFLFFFQTHHIKMKGKCNANATLYPFLVSDLIRLYRKNIFTGGYTH